MLGTRLGPYTLVAELGAGGMGKVWRAEVTGRAHGLEAGAVVALKLVHPHLLETPGFFKRFLREAEFGKAVVHENVVRTYDSDQLVVDGRPQSFLVMEYVEGRTLRALLDELERVPEELCRHIGREVAKGLAAIHAAGVVHRDLKPENVLITKDHAVKVMDLGVARLADETIRLSQSGAFVGSVEYAAPEQFGAKDVGAAADLHALGLVLYELATAHHPYRADDFGGVMRRVLDERPRRPAEINPQLSPFFEELVLQLLAKKPQERIASAAQLAQILDEGESSVWWREKAHAIRAATRRPLRRTRIPRGTALYGRETELALLRALYERASRGDGQVLLIEGEAGIGKSRLVDEFVGLLAQAGEDVNFLFGSYPPGGAATASGAFSTAYREHLGDDEAALRAALPQTPLLVPAFAALLRGDSAPEGAEPLTKDSLQTVFVHATRSLAAERPTIVLIDDLHFAPHEGRALFTSLALGVQGHRVLLVGCARPGLDETWLAQLASLQQTTQLAIPRLSPKDLIHVLRDALKSERLAEELGGLIAVKSDGNPFFVLELLRGLRDGQFLRERPDGTWETTQIIRDIQVPSSIAQLVQARVADLDADDKNLLDAAACCGFEFDPLLVAAALSAGEIPALQRLARIERRHRLVRSAGRRFAFDHHQVQEALYAGLPELLRERYHNAIAEAIEARCAASSKAPKDLEGAVCVDLAEHFLKGAQGLKAVRHLEPALTHLEKGYLNDQAVALADRALAVPGLFTGRERIEVLLRKAGRLDLLGRREAERAVLLEALALADDTQDAGLRARARAAQGWLLFRLSRHAEAESVLRETHDLARTAGDRRTEADVAGTLGTVFRSLGRYAEAQAQFERSVALASETGDLRRESRSLGNLAIVLKSLGRYAEAKARCEHALAIALQIGDRLAESRVRGNLGIVLDSFGRNAEAQPQYERCLATAREIGDRQGEANAAGYLGNAASALGRHAEAQAHYERWLALTREIGDRQGEAMATGNLGIVFKSIGRTAEAQALYERRLAMAREFCDREGEAAALSNLGALRLVLGDRAGARRAAEASLAICRSIGARHAEGFSVGVLAEVADEEGDIATALRHAEDALALRRAMGQQVGVAESLVHLGKTRQRAGNADGARSALEEALTFARTQQRESWVVDILSRLANLPGGDARAAETALAEAGGSLAGFDAARVHFLLWTAARDRTHLAEAKRLLDSLVELAPPSDREPMLANVRLHREILAACAEQGL